ncbi:MAG: aspartate kinase [Anaerolineaceae bacterium]|nr:aspartate kinase [Anaerolineaceae bacterium]
MMGTLVMKFGGSCVGTTSALTQTLNIVLHESHQWERLVLVVSALDGVTDVLIEATDMARLGDQRGYRRTVANLRTRHVALAGTLPLEINEKAALEAEIDRLLLEMLNLYQDIANAHTQQEAMVHYDATIGMGERLTARIVAALIRQNGIPSVAIDGTGLIITDDTIGSATATLTETQHRVTSHLNPILDRQIIPVVTGFIGTDSSGRTTTLGRGGSDYTAAILGSCLQAQEVWIWTGVDGLMTADPQVISSAQVIPRLSYEEVSELAYFGARILHTHMMEVLREQQIPVRVKNFRNPRRAGTLIHQYNPHTSHVIKAVTSIPGFGLTVPLSSVIPTLEEIVEQVVKAVPPGHADVATSSRSSTYYAVYFLTPTAAGPNASHYIQTTLGSSLKANRNTQHWELKPVSIITVIGDYLNEVSAVTAGILQVMSGIPILALMQGPTGCSLSLIVHVEQSTDALNRIHQLILNSG